MVISQARRHPSAAEFTLPWGDATQVSLDAFTNDFMPPLPSGLNLEAIVRRLITTRRTGRQVITKTGRLWGYGRTMPSQMAPSRAFVHLKICVDRLVAALPRGTTGGRQFRFTHHEFPTEAYTFDSLPNAFFERYEEPSSRSPQWTSVAVSGVYTLGATHLSMLEVSLYFNSRSQLCLTGIRFVGIEEG